MKTVNKIAFMLTVLIGFFTSCGREVNSRSFSVLLKSLLSHSVPEITVTAAAAKNTAIYLDARETNEYNVSHIDQAVWVGAGTFDLENVKDIDKDAQVIVYCSIGLRSEKVAEKLIKAGYTNVSNLYGGIFEWVNAGNVVVNPFRVPTDTIHAYSKVWGRWLTKGKKVYN